MVKDQLWGGFPPNVQTFYGGLENASCWALEGVNQHTNIHGEIPSFKLLRMVFHSRFQFVDVMFLVFSSEKHGEEETKLEIGRSFFFSCSEIVLPCTL
jgi:hypothetical protein